ncbi:hypothetical protein MVEN_00223200 [Mycena venus]|uniref:Uncharacterized protein n=1 Tax=Mycena venus TaxID=2733690 RepID=A0A8H6Z100_9AGAR|nr:hypothetical protein MVEN_00223200 [Mycena venus]
MTFRIDNGAKMGVFLRSGFVTAFPKITRLVLELDIEMMSSPLVNPPSDAVPPRGLRSLRLAGHSALTILTWLHHFPNVDSVALCFVDKDGVQAVRAALQQLGSALHHLDINFASSEVVIDLSLHPNLRTLIIRDHVCPRSSHHMIILLQRLAAPGLESLSLQLKLSTYRKFNWAALEAFLCPTRFPRLRRVEFSQDGDYNPNGLQFLREALPLLEASGVLRTDSKIG